jgi:hypothetical protein
MKGISRWIKSKKFIKKTIKTILSSLRSQNYFLSGWQKEFLFLSLFMSPGLSFDITKN